MTFSFLLNEENSLLRLCRLPTVLWGSCSCHLNVYTWFAHNKLGFSEFIVWGSVFDGGLLSLRASATGGAVNDTTLHKSVRVCACACVPMHLASIWRPVTSRMSTTCTVWRVHALVAVATTWRSTRSQQDDANRTEELVTCFPVWLFWLCMNMSVGLERMEMQQAPISCFRTAWWMRAWA